MRFPAPLPATVLRTISGMMVTLALAFVPAKTFAQRAGAAGAAAAHPVAPRPGVVRVPQPPVTRAPQAPVVRSPGAIIRPTGMSPLTRPPFLIQPGTVGPATQLRSPLLTSIALLGSRPPRYLRVTPVVLFNPYPTAGLFGFGFNGLFPCPFASGYGCGATPPNGYGFPAVPQGAYPRDPSYPTPDPNYAAVAGPSPSTALQYTSLLGAYSSLGNLPDSNSSAIKGASGPSPDYILLYFKDGSVFTIASYTVAGGRLHYVTAYHEEGDVEVRQLDVQKTIQANAARSVTFTLTPPSRGAGTVASGPPSPGPAQPGPINPPKP